MVLTVDIHCPKIRVCGAKSQVDDKPPTPDRSPTMATAKGWVYGDYLFCDRPVEVVELHMKQRGLPSKSLGKWHARYKLGEGAYAETCTAFDSREAAQRYLLDQLRELCELFERNRQA
jgi:hypothetical protein